MLGARARPENLEGLALVVALGRERESVVARDGDDARRHGDLLRRARAAGRGRPALLDRLEHGPEGVGRAEHDRGGEGDVELLAHPGLGAGLGLGSLHELRERRPEGHERGARRDRLDLEPRELEARRRELGRLGHALRERGVRAARSAIVARR